MPGFTELERLMNPQAAAPMNPMEQPNQMAQQQAASELELQTLLQQIRERFEAQREAQLAQTSEQFDPILDRMRGNLESAAAPVPQGSRLGDLGEIIANAFYTSKFKERLKTPYERRQSEAGIRQQQEMNALAQLRLMMEGKSKAEDRITKSFDDRTKAEIEAASKSLKAQQDQKKWEAGMGLRREAEDRLQAGALLRRDQEIRQQRQYANTPAGQAEEFYKKNAPPGMDRFSPEGIKFYNQALKYITEQGKPGSEGKLVTASNALGEVVPIRLPSARPYSSGLPKSAPLDVDQFGPTEKRTSIPNQAPPSAGAAPVETSYKSSKEVPFTPANRSSWLSGVFSKTPTISSSDLKFKSTSDANRVLKAIETNKNRASQGRGALDAFAKVIEGGHLKFLSAWDFSKMIDLMGTTVFDPTSGASQADRFRNAMTEAAAERSDATVQDIRKWETLPDPVLELYMKLGSALNQYIKTMTGVAASSKEFGRLTMVEPTRLDSPNGLAIKLAMNTMASIINEAESGAYQVDGKNLHQVFKESGTPFEKFISDVSMGFKDGVLSGSLDRRDIMGFLKENTFLQAAVMYDRAYQTGGPEEAEQVVQKLLERFARKGNVIEEINKKHPPTKDLFERRKK